jgi:hypothetical protein
MLRVKPSAADKLESARSRTPQTRQLGNILGHPTRTVNLPRGEDDGHQHAPLLLRDAVPEPATPANMILGNACLRPGLIDSKSRLS